MPGASSDEAVRIFVEFSHVESAVEGRGGNAAFISRGKCYFAVLAVKDMNGRYFGGRMITASFFDEERFRKFDLGP